MENAADALKMAAAVLIFVIALSTAIYGFTRARQAASAVISKSDSTRYYDQDNIDILDSRIVGIETVIPTLYSYFKEGYTVLFYEANWDGKVPSNIKPMTLYYSEALPVNLNMSRLQNNNDTRYGSNGSYVDNEGRTQIYYRGIYGLDSDDESTRREPWASDDVTYKNFIMSLINRVETPEYFFSRVKYSDSSPNIINRTNNTLKMSFEYQFTGNTALSALTNAKFLERSGIYNADRTKVNDNLNDISTDITIDESRIEFESGVYDENGTGIQKKVIQYIYLK